MIQLYVAPRAPKAFRPPKELKAFAKVSLDPGATTIVELELDDRSFARWSEGDPTYAALIARQSTDAAWMPPPPDLDPRGWAIDPGTYDVHIGRSSANIVHSAQIEVTPR